MKKFNLKQAILENKATFYSSLREGFQGEFYAPEYLEQKYGKKMASKIEAEIDEMDPNSWDRFTGMESAKEVEDYISDIVDMLKEGKKSKQYYKDAEADDAEHIKALEKDMKDDKKASKKLKESKLRSKIREMILAEMALDIDNMEDAPESEVDFLSELESMLDEEGDIYEAKKDEEEAPEETPAPEEEEVDTTVDIETDEVNPAVKAVQDALTQAQAAAQKLGDEKLLNQIGNTITFFTREHVVEKPGEALNESMFPILKKILK